jgi:hypothetical protein
MTWRAPKVMIVMMRMAHDAILMVSVRSIVLIDVLLAEMYTTGSFILGRKNDTTLNKPAQKETIRK